MTGSSLSGVETLITGWKTALKLAAFTCSPTMITGLFLCDAQRQASQEALGVALESITCHGKIWLGI